MSAHTMQCRPCTADTSAEYATAAFWWAPTKGPSPMSGQRSCRRARLACRPKRPAPGTCTGIATRLDQAFVTRVGRKDGSAEADLSPLSTIVGGKIFFGFPYSPPLLFPSVQVLQVGPRVVQVSEEVTSGTMDVVQSPQRTIFCHVFSPSAGQRHGRTKMGVVLEKRKGIELPTTRV